MGGTPKKKSHKRIRDPVATRINQSCSPRGGVRKRQNKTRETNDSRVCVSQWITLTLKCLHVSPKDRMGMHFDSVSSCQLLGYIIRSEWDWWWRYQFGKQQGTASQHPVTARMASSPSSFHRPTIPRFLFSTVVKWMRFKDGTNPTHPAATRNGSFCYLPVQTYRTDASWFKYPIRPSLIIEKKTSSFSFLLERKGSQQDNIIWQVATKMLCCVRKGNRATPCPSKWVRDAMGRAQNRI